MTHEEAIAFLEQYINSEVYAEKCISAHEMAITALRSAHAGEAMGYHFLIPHTRKMQCKRLVRASWSGIHLPFRLHRQGGVEAVRRMCSKLFVVQK